MEPGAAELYDQALLGILQHVGNVQDFLRVLFGFLYRKTDFYRLLRHPTDRMGFPPGAAQALVLQVTGRPGEQGGGRGSTLPGGPFPGAPDPRDFAARPSLRARPQFLPPALAWAHLLGPRLRVSRAAGRVSSCSSGERAWRSAARVTPGALGCQSSLAPAALGPRRRRGCQSGMEARTCAPRATGWRQRGGLVTCGFCGCGPLV